MRVAVLGAGLQGSCTALELASRGIKVDVYEKHAAPMSGASAHTEGKIHLGYVYANDPSLKTARRMIAGALSFSPLMSRLLGPQFKSVSLSSPYCYVVHAQSLLDVNAVEQHLSRVRALHIEAIDQNGGDYFGIDPQTPLTRWSEQECKEYFDKDAIAAVFTTPEIAVNPAVLAGLVRAALASAADVAVFPHCTVTAVSEADNGMMVKFENSTGAQCERYDHVVNALWEGRLAIDATVGLVPHRPWLFRFRHFLSMEAPSLPDDLPSATIVLGPFGDVVNFGNGHFHLSWYPAGLRGVSAEITPPNWIPAPPHEASEIRRETAAALARILPKIAAAAPSEIDEAELMAGTIFAWGETDIDDPGSGLHERHAIGPISRGRYHSIDTGKYTMAPLFARQVADRICSLT